MNSELFWKITERLNKFWKTIGAKKDQFGASEEFLAFLRPFFQFLYFVYFRVKVTGVKNIPKSGAVILVGNHSGALPYDGTMAHIAVYNEHPSKRLLRFLVDDFVYKLPLVGEAIERAGGIRASFENALDMLKHKHAVMIFPEGVEGVGKEFDQRYILRPFKHGGFVRLAMKTHAPVVPVAIIGAEEIHPIVWKSRLFGALLGVPFVPFTPTFPWLGPLGLVPLPSKWKIVFGKPISFKKFRATDAKNDRLVMREANSVRGVIQKMIDKELKSRKSIWV